MDVLREQMSAGVIEQVFDAPEVRADAVARARALLATDTWCRADEVAGELVSCFVGCRLP